MALTARELIRSSRAAPVRGGRQDAPIEVLIFHGYLLRGTGSNVYTASVARALCELGHRVHLLCQDRDAGLYPWVDAVGTWEDGGLTVEPTGVPGVTRCELIAYLPPIGELLPVYVEDPYEGFDSRAYPRLEDEQIDRYVEANVAAVTDVAARAGGIDAALSNHLVMGPLILARAGLPFAAKIHGSALSYVVAPHRERFGPAAAEGLGAARAALVGSRHTAESLWETVELEGLEQKTRLGPPGVDVERFAPPDREPAQILGELATEIRAVEEEAGGSAPSFGRDPDAAVEAIEAHAAAAGARVLFVGKTIVSKGCDLLLAAWPLFAASRPGAHLLIVGFGELRDALEELWAALSTGELERACEMAAQGRALEGGPEGPLRLLAAFLDRAGTDYAEAGLAAAGSVSFAGRLEHEEVAEAVRGSGAMVVPSTFPEAFGMVAAEAAAAGVLPICADHSGLHEVAAELGRALPEAARGLTSLPLDDGSIESIAARLEAWFTLPAEDSERTREALRAAVVERWSWEGVARGVLDAAAGRLDRLVPVPGQLDPRT